MKRIKLIRSILSSVLALSLLMIPLSVHATEAPSCRAVSESNQPFAVDLYQKLMSGEGHLFFSSYSIFVALNICAERA